MEKALKYGEGPKIGGNHSDGGVVGGGHNYRVHCKAWGAHNGGGRTEF